MTTVEAFIGLVYLAATTCQGRGSYLAARSTRKATRLLGLVLAFVPFPPVGLACYWLGWSRRRAEARRGRGSA